MNDKLTDHESFRTFQLMNELESGSAVSQRELASRLGIAVGLVNSYLKNFAAKGYIRVKNYPRNRYAYLLTSKGIAEKSRLAFQHINYFTSLYTTTRSNFQELFKGLHGQGVTEVVFCGVDEVAEIAYLSLQEVDLKLSEVFDEVAPGKTFMNYQVLTLEDIPSTVLCVVITSLKRGQQLHDALLERGVDGENIYRVDDLL